MRERILDIVTPSGPMETFITHPSGGGRFRPVVLYMDMWGVREELYDLARRVSTAGYYCLVPDLYYRSGKYRNAERDEHGRMKSFAALGPEAQERQLSAMRRLTDRMAIDGTGSLLEFMDRGEPVLPGAVGCIGYCLGGRIVLCAAGSFPDRFRAGACLHGVNLVNDKPDSPHLLAKKGEGELYCGHAEKDRFSSPEVIKVLDETLRDAKLRYFCEIHKGADHGYALPDRDVFDKQAANRDWELIFAMFRRQLPWA